MENDLTPPIIRQRAARALLTMDQLYKRSGVSSATFWKWERDEVVPGLLVIERLRYALEVAERERPR